MAELEPVVVAGVGGMGREALDLLLACNAQAPRYEILGFVDDDPQQHGTTCCGHPVLGGSDWVEGRGDVGIVCAVGSNRIRARIAHRFRALGCERFPTVIHPAASVSSMATLAEGCIVAAGAVITCQIDIGRFAIINVGSTISHDNRLGDFAMLDPGAHLAGRVTLEAGVEVGTGESIITDCTVGEGTFVGAGAVVVGDLPAHTIATGVPARPTRPIPHADRFKIPA